jgi:RNA polymerase sigma-70 factor, ECF subfamily
LPSRPNVLTSGETTPLQHSEESLNVFGEGGLPAVTLVERHESVKLRAKTDLRQATRSGSTAEDNAPRMTFKDYNLTRKAARGDIEAFSQLVREHSGLVYRVAARILGDSDAQDATQEVWIRVWRNVKSFRGESAFSTWLYKITVNTCLSTYRRKQSREARETGEDLAHLPVPPSIEDDPVAATVAGERREELLRALERVRPEHRAALVLRHMEGLSYVEVAQVLEVPEGTAKGWVNRGRAALLVALSAERGSA